MNCERDTLVRKHNELKCAVRSLLRKFPNFYYYADVDYTVTVVRHFKGRKEEQK